MKKQNGITLLALVITIIVLLILASVSIATLMGEDGIIFETRNANSETNKAAAKEELTLAWQDVNMEYRQAYTEDKTIKKEDYFTVTNLNKYLGNKGTVIKLNYNSNETTTLTYSRNEDGNLYSVEINSNGKLEIQEILEDDDTYGVTLSDDYGHSYTVTEAGKYYFYSYTYGQNFMSVFEVTGEENDLQATKLGEYSYETGAKRDSGELFGDSSFFSGMTCLSSSEELAETYSVGFLYVQSLDENRGVDMKLTPGYYVDIYDAGSGYIANKCYVVEEDGTLKEYDASYYNSNLFGDVQWVELGQLSVSGVQQN